MGDFGAYMAQKNDQAESAIKRIQNENTDLRTRLKIANVLLAQVMEDDGYCTVGAIDHTVECTSCRIAAYLKS